MEIYSYKVSLYANRPKGFREEKDIKCEVLDVIGENEKFICVNDYWFSTICKDPKSFIIDGVLDIPNISIYVNDSIWGNGFYYKLFSTKPKSSKAIKKEIEKAIEKKVGFFMNGINLDFITDKLEV